MKAKCTDSVKASGYQAHGRVRYKVIDDNIILYQATGPFNLELLMAFQQVQPNLEMHKQHNKWAEIVIFQESCLAPNDFIEQFALFLQELKSNSLNAAATAYILPDDIEGAFIMKDKFKASYENAGINFAVFEDNKTATDWVKSFL
ncbi:hypothetical protein [Colwellia sp. MEBiC06753]